MNLVLFGPPGAGKGTQGTMLADSRGLLKISTGDILRDASRAGTPLGLEARKYMNAGELVPDMVILGLVREVIEDAPDAKGFIMDGFPRTLPQAAGVDRLLEEIGKPIDVVITLEVDDDDLVKRLSGRRTCPNCGAVYNVYFDKPQQDEICDRCGSELIQRADDSQQTVLRRLEVYREQTAPLISYYEGRQVPVERVAGSGPIEDVQREILRIVDR